MTLGMVFYLLAAIILLTVGFDIVDAEFDAWMVSAGLALLGLMFSSITIPVNFTKNE